MADIAEEFFTRLGQRSPEPLLRRATGTIRFDLDNGDGTQRWFVAMAKGEVTVARRGTKADSVLHADKAIFERVLTGELNAMAAALRGAVRIEGDPELFVLFQRVLPGGTR
ncbi:MAG: SCP2 sterol-binding domain-containing protein [Micromonosporaceae bacterium]